MKTIGNKLESFSVTASSPASTSTKKRRFGLRDDHREELCGKWKVIYFWPKDFTFVCPTEIVGFDKLARQFEERDAVLLGGSVDNEFSKLGWRREHKDFEQARPLELRRREGSLVDQLGVRDAAEGVALAGDLHRRPRQRDPAR